MKTPIDYTEMCHCGQPLHYRNPAHEKIMRGIVAEHGPMMPVTVGDRTWLVARHYVALHGIVGSQVPLLGFEEVTTSHETKRPADTKSDEAA